MRWRVRCRRERVAGSDAKRSGGGDHDLARPACAWGCRSGHVGEPPGEVKRDERSRERRSHARSRLPIKLPGVNHGADSGERHPLERK